MADLEIPQGDYGYTLTFNVKTSAGVAFDLTDYTVTLHCFPKTARSITRLSEECTITDAANGVCTYTIASGDFNISEVLDVELELTKVGVVESTQMYTFEVR